MGFDGQDVLVDADFNISGLVAGEGSGDDEALVVLLDVQRQVRATPGGASAGAGPKPRQSWSKTESKPVVRWKGR